MNIIEPGIFQAGKYYIDPIPELSGELFCSYSGIVSGQALYIFETFGDSDTFMAVIYGERLTVYKKFMEPVNCTPAGYKGIPIQELKDSGRDLLAEKIIPESFGLNDIKGILPSEFSNGYLSLGYYTSPRTFTVRSSGDIYFQPDFSLKAPNTPAFSPSELGADKSKQTVLSFADGIIPVLFGMHSASGDKLETMYCVGHGDCDFEYGIWIRAVRLKNNRPSEIRLINAGCCNIGKRLPLSDKVFYECLVGVFAHYEDFKKNSCLLSLPEKDLERVCSATLMTADGLINGFQPKYGNMFYSLESHNNFPPNFIMAIQTFAMCGQLRKARLITEHFLTNCVDNLGRIIYRQGDSQFYGYSGSEAGQLFWVIRRSFPLVCGSFISEYIDILLKIADNIISFIAESEEIPGVFLVHMCAEADTNGRVYDYIQNTLWTIRGLDALCDILRVNDSDCSKYSQISHRLSCSVNTICEKLTINTAYGELIPFQLQYSPLPLTLSRCRDTSVPVTDAELDCYLSGDTNPRNDISGRQNLLENNYANYRYYPEILSSFILEEKYANTIDKMRSHLGGEFMCMTRFMNGIDDWPAYNDALFLLESGRYDKFRLLMYSHILYHGLPDFGIYYEQVGISGAFMNRNADSCLPSTLLPPFMIVSMLCHLTVDCQTILLCAGVPEEWFKTGFSFENIGCAGGKVSLCCKNKTIYVSLAGDLKVYTKKLFLPDGNGISAIEFSGNEFSVSFG